MSFEDLKYHCINCAGTLVIVDAEVRQEIERWLREEDRKPLDSIDIVDLYGSDTTIIADAINVFYETTPEMRRIERQLRKDLKAEAMSQGFSEDDDD